MPGLGLAILHRYDLLLDEMTEWLGEQVRESGTTGFVIGVSGGLDSAVLASVAKRSGRPVHLLHLLAETSTTDRRDSERLAQVLGVPIRVVDLESAWSLVGTRMDREVLAHHEDLAGSTASGRSNLKSRLRMAALYYVANATKSMVASAATKPDLAFGYVTKYGDSYGDLFPLAGLLKSEVRRLGELLGVPKEILEKPPSAGLWQGQTDEEELGLTEEQIEQFFRKWGDERFEVAGYITYLNLSPTEIAIVQRMKANTHKGHPINLFPLSRERYGVTGLSLTPLRTEESVLSAIRSGAEKAGEGPAKKSSFLEPEIPSEKEKEKKADHR